MSDRFDNLSSRLDDYFDGRLTDEERRAFEELVGANPRLQAEVSAQRRVDSALSRRFDRSCPDEFVARLSVAGRGRGARAGAARHGRAWKRVGALAAAVALVFLSGWLNREAVMSSRFGRWLIRTAQYDVARQYDADVQNGFVPQLVCETDEDFQALLRERYGTALSLASAPGVSAIGWSYSELISPSTLRLLVTVERSAEAHGGGSNEEEAERIDHVLVFFDRAGAGPAPGPPRTPSLRMYHRRYGTVDAYEVTPLTRPRVLDLLRTPG